VNQLVPVTSMARAGNRSSWRTSANRPTWVRMQVVSCSRPGPHRVAGGGRGAEGTQVTVRFSDGSTDGRPPRTDTLTDWTDTDPMALDYAAHLAAH
jgi:hypothetical protein